MGEATEKLYAALADAGFDVPRTTVTCGILTRNEIGDSNGARWRNPSELRDSGRPQAAIGRLRRAVATLRAGRLARAGIPVSPRCISRRSSDVEQLSANLQAHAALPARD